MIWILLLVTQCQCRHGILVTYNTVSNLRPTNWIPPSSRSWLRPSLYQYKLDLINGWKIHDWTNFIPQITGTARIRIPHKLITFHHRGSQAPGLKLGIIWFDGSRSLVWILYAQNMLEGVLCDWTIADNVFLDYIWLFCGAILTWSTSVLIVEFICHVHDWTWNPKLSLSLPSFYGEKNITFLYNVSYKKECTHSIECFTVLMGTYNYNYF